MSKPTEKKPFFTPEQKEKIKRDLELYRQGKLKDEWEDFDLIDVDNAGPWPEDGICKPLRQGERTKKVPG